MTMITSPHFQHHTADSMDSINLYSLGMLFVVRCRYWSCRAGNDPGELELTDERIQAKALASFGTKDLLDPEKTRKVFAAIEKKARHTLEKHSRPFAAANAHFVPWNHVQTVIDQLEACRAEFDAVVSQFLADYSKLRADWTALHPQIPASCYPLPLDRSGRFSLSWHAFKVTGAPELTAVEDIELELEQRRVRDEQVQLMEDSLKRECQRFVEEYVLGFRREVAEFCDQVVEQKGQVHGRTLKRRLNDAGLPTILTCHSFRATTATDLLEQGVPLEDVQELLGHADPRTTRLYDRRDRKVTRNVVERISI